MPDQRSPEGIAFSTSQYSSLSVAWEVSCQGTIDVSVFREGEGAGRAERAVPASENLPM